MKSLQKSRDKTQKERTIVRQNKKHQEIMNVIEMRDKTRKIKNPKGGQETGRIRIHRKKQTVRVFDKQEDKES